MVNANTDHHRRYNGAYRQEELVKIHLLFKDRWKISVHGTPFCDDDVNILCRYSKDTIILIISDSGFRIAEYYIPTSAIPNPKLNGQSN